MGKSRRQDTRSERSERETVRELKSIIKEKDKEIGRLRKELSRRVDLSHEFHELVEDLREKDFETKPPAVNVLSCPKCRKTIRTIEGAKFTILVCPHCSWRTRKK